MLVRWLVDMSGFRNCHSVCARRNCKHAEISLRWLVPPQTWDQPCRVMLEHDWQVLTAQLGQSSERLWQLDVDPRGSASNFSARLVCAWPLHGTCCCSRQLLASVQRNQALDSLDTAARACFGCVCTCTRVRPALSGHHLRGSAHSSTFSRNSIILALRGSCIELLHASRQSVDTRGTDEQDPALGHSRPQLAPGTRRLAKRPVASAWHPA